MFQGQVPTKRTTKLLPCYKKHNAGFLSNFSPDIILFIIPLGQENKYIPTQIVQVFISLVNQIIEEAS